MKKNLLTLTGTLILLWAALNSCSLIQRAAVGDKRDIRTKSQTVDLGGAESAAVHLKMSAGEMTVNGGASDLMAASFRYDVEDFKPQVMYSVNNGQGDLRVEQNNTVVVGPQLVNQWEIALSDSVPLDVSIITGAGKGSLNLNTLELSNAYIETGAGAVDIVLNGSWDHDVMVTIKGGVGSITLRLPTEMGVQVDVTGGLVSANASGFSQDGNRYTNPVFSSAPHTIFVTVEAGIGSINLDAQ